MTQCALPWGTIKLHAPDAITWKSCSVAFEHNKLVFFCVHGEAVSEVVTRQVHLCPTGHICACDVESLLSARLFVARNTVSILCFVCPLVLSRQWLPALWQLGNIVPSEPRDSDERQWKKCPNICVLRSCLWFEASSPLCCYGHTYNCSMHCIPCTSLVCTVVQV